MPPFFKETLGHHPSEIHFVQHIHLSEKIRKRLIFSKKKQALYTGKHAGSLFLIGGGEDKRDSKTVLSSLLQSFNPQKIALIPTASQYPRDVSETYTNAFRDLGFRQLELLDIRQASDANDPRNIEIISTCDLVFFSGGDQVKLVSVLEGSRIMEIIRERFYNEGLNMAGTSAGTAAMSKNMLFDGDGRGLRKGYVKAAVGFGILPGICLDTHFSQRNRLFRLAQFIAAGYADKGIGIDEDTAIFIRQGREFEVIGNASVSLLERKKQTQTDFHYRNEGDAFSCSGLQLDVLSPGARFDLISWKLII